jgi:hypothetical protein
MVLGSANIWVINVAYIFRTGRFSIVKMQAAGSSETLVLPDQAITRYIPQDQTHFTLEYSSFTFQISKAHFSTK